MYTYTSMSHLINVNDEVYEELSSIKKIRKESYSQVIKELLTSKKTNQKFDLKAIIQNAKKRSKEYTGPKEKVNHDLIAYGASR